MSNSDRSFMAYERQHVLAALRLGKKLAEVRWVAESLLVSARSITDSDDRERSVGILRERLFTVTAQGFHLVTEISRCFPDAIQGSCSDLRSAFRGCVSEVIAEASD